jgi:pyruvate kinase
MPYHKHWWSQHTKIVCTLGPASADSRVIERLIRAGMDVARLNMSHGTKEEHAHSIKIVRELNRRLESHVAILMDLPGPKYRTGEMPGGSAVLKKGDHFILTTRQIAGNSKAVSINLPSLSHDAKIGGTVLVDDGAMQLKIVDVQGDDVVCKVIAGGILTPGRGVVLPGVPISEPFMTEKLKQHLEFALQQGPEYIALSFVSSAEDVLQVRAILRQHNSDIPLISKIESAEAVRNFDNILEASDGIMVARGDMGVELPLQKVPIIQKEIIRSCNRAGKAVITATQMLESMVTSARPTRAEVTDVANAILDGTDAIMLSAETSMGKYPVQALKMMFDIATETEHHLPYESMLTQRGQWVGRHTDEIISYNACYTALQLKAVAIVAYTHSGSTARRVSKYRPNIPIIAITPDQTIAGRLILYWGVHAFHVPGASSVDDLFETGANLVQELKIARPGDLIVITGGIPLGRAGTTNLLKVQEIPR